MVNSRMYSNFIEHHSVLSFLITYSVSISFKYNQTPLILHRSLPFEITLVRDHPSIKISVSHPNLYHDKLQ